MIVLTPVLFDYPKALACYLLLAIALSSGTSNAQNKAANLPQTKIDFSYAGYKGGGVSLPQVAAVLMVRPTGGDDTKLLQSALTRIGNLPLDHNGFRGALQLAEGTYRVSGQIVLNKSGVVIRGSTNKGKTVIVATGNNRRSLVKIGDVDSISAALPVAITNTIVPAGSIKLKLVSVAGLNIGHHIVITRASTASWISDLGMDKDDGMFADRRGMIWPGGSRDLRWDRIITAIDPATKEISFDAPITTSLQQLYGGGTVRVTTTNDLVNNCGLEGITLESEFAKENRFDEEHAWTGISINYSEDTWIREVTMLHFAGSAVRVGPRARRVTIVNCGSREPISEIGGYRRNSFLVEGEQVLVNKCTSDSGMNDFATGFCAGGPNVFLDCKATNALGASGSFESWASGVLYENVQVEENDLRLTFDFTRTQGAGWTAANSMIWNCKANNMEALGPAGYENILVNSAASLYNDQLANRPGKTKPSGFLVNLPAKNIGHELREFTSKDIPAEPPALTGKENKLTIVNGRFVIGGKVVWGGTTGDQFWRGQPFPGGELNSGICITRFVPGRTGTGLTEDLPLLAQRLENQGNIFYQSITGLWYDRRRDDHSTFERKDGMVWAPFLEMPWARSGREKAWDGLSKFDLLTFNPWYFGRLKEFAALCNGHGLVLYHSLYNTHNLLEYLTHWVDHPFRPANNINNTGLPEPPPEEAWARFHGANQFYDPANPALAKLHHAYIFHVLDEIGKFDNVIFNLGGEFSGPLVFQRFFIQTLDEWERKNNRNVLLVLNTSKDITDSILADPVLAKQVDVIDTRYWQYRPAGTFASGDDVWQPPGGTNRSFREMVGESFILQSGMPFSTQQEQMYRQVREYTDRFPGKAVVSAYNDVSPIPSLMAGGAQVLMGSQKDGWEGRTTFSTFVQKYLADIVMNMKPDDEVVADQKQNWSLSDAKNGSLLVYSLGGETITITRDLAGRNLTALWFDPLSEKTVPFEGQKSFAKGTVIKKPSGLRWMLLLRAVSHQPSAVSR